jgi:NAD(P)-dependent dehydrogenase (short-subunit alcohol dehydrogenase family)
MQQRGGGRIINFASINGVYGSKYGLAYNAAKEAIRGLTRTLANEWGRFNITVNVVMPSGMSPSYQAFYNDDPKKADAVAKLNPMRRHGRSQEDIGNAVLGLVSDAGRYITGQSLFIDGGANLLGLPQLHAAGIQFQ